MKKGQASVEFLAVVAFFLLVTTPIFIYFFSSAPEKDYYASMMQAQFSAEEFVKYGELVGAQGNGTKVMRVIVVPPYTKKVLLNGTHAVITIKYGDTAMYSDIIRRGAVNFSETAFELGGGTYTFLFENQGGVVNVSKR